MLSLFLYFVVFLLYFCCIFVVFLLFLYFVLYFTAVFVLGRLKQGFWVLCNTEMMMITAAGTAKEANFTSL